jgi:NADH-quinone oxidoreductase subunit J
LQLNAEFIAVMQILVYAGAILVIFMFVIILFQDAHQQIEQYLPKSKPLLLYSAAVAFVLALPVLAHKLMDITPAAKGRLDGFGTVETLGKALYVDFFFPFEAVTLLFLVAVIGAFYIGRKEATPAIKSYEPKNGVSADSPGKGSPDRGTAFLGKKDLAGVAEKKEA